MAKSTKANEFIYDGPSPAGVTLRYRDGETREVMLYHGRRYTLPAKHPHVARLMERGFLVRAPEPEPKKAKAPAKKAGGSSGKKTSSKKTSKSSGSKGKEKS